MSASFGNREEALETKGVWVGEGREDGALAHGVLADHQGASGLSLE